VNSVWNGAMMTLEVWHRAQTRPHTVDFGRAEGRKRINVWFALGARHTCKTKFRAIKTEFEATFRRFLYGGMVTGDKNRESLQRMLNLPPPERKHQPAVAAIKPGEEGSKPGKRAEAEEDLMIPGGLMLAESQAQTDSKMAVVPAEQAAGSLVSYDYREGEEGGDPGEFDVFGMWDPVPQDALISQPGAMQVCQGPEPTNDN
jgi:hypothetical protein